MNVKKYFTTLGISLGVMLLLAGIAIIAIYIMLGGKLTVNDVGQLLVNPQLPGKTNVLIMGTDASNARSDTIMVAMLDPKIKRADIFTVPRDTRVYFDGKYHKINSANVLGGAELTERECEKLLGIDIQYYVDMHLEGFRNIIDILGGVYYDVPIDMDYEDPTQDLYIHLKKGYQLLDGKKAEQFVRFRKGNDGGGYPEGDLGRGKAQRDFLRQLFVQKVNPVNIAKAPALLNEITKNVKTNIPVSDYPKYIAFVSKLSNDNFELHDLPGEAKYMDGLWYFLPDTKEIRKIISQIESGQQPEASPSPTARPTPAVEKSTAKSTNRR